MLYLSKEQVAELVEHSKREFPNEACGILAGKEGKVDPSMLRHRSASMVSGIEPSTSSLDFARDDGEQTKGVEPSLRVNGERSRTIEKIYQMTNTDKSKVTYFMAPEEQLKVVKEIRNLGLKMVGIYHSHTESPAYPSAHDVKLAFYPETSYVIVSLQDKVEPKIRSFKIVEGEIKEEKITVG